MSLMATKMVHVRVDEKVKAQAERALLAMGLTTSDAVRVFLVRVAAEQALPFEVRVPNATTKAAIRELRGEKPRRFKTVAALFDDLNDA